MQGTNSFYVVKNLKNRASRILLKQKGNLELKTKCNLCHKMYPVGDL